MLLRIWFWGGTNMTIETIGVLRNASGKVGGYMVNGFGRTNSDVLADVFSQIDYLFEGDNEICDYCKKVCCMCYEEHLELNQ